MAKPFCQKRFRADLYIYQVIVIVIVKAAISLKRSHMCSMVRSLQRSLVGPLTADHCRFVATVSTGAGRLHHGHWVHCLASTGTMACG